MQSGEQVRYAVLIPAYRPSAGLIDLVRDLAARGMPAILIVDDGSGPGFRGIFDRVAELPKVQVLRHAVNLGKGAALKTGIHHALGEFPELTGVVTADADGQHHPADIERVAAVLTENPDALVLGCRTFDDAVPLRSRFGNILTRRLMQLLIGASLQDTQTGLRGIPAAMFAPLLRVEARGYEFELEMLIAWKHQPDGSQWKYGRLLAGAKRRIMVQGVAGGDIRLIADAKIQGQLSRGSPVILKVDERRVFVLVRGKR
jgi:glycosyltransferase involved in cell wall biosynthesis